MSWNQQGQPGAAGPTGPAGKEGARPTVAQLGAGTLPASGGIVIHGGDIETVANDVETQIDHDETTRVGNDGTTSIGRNESIGTGGSRTSVVGANEAITIDGNRRETVQNSQTLTVDASRTERVGLNDSLIVSASRTERIGNQFSLLAGGTASLDGRSVANSGGVQGGGPDGDLVSSVAILTGSGPVCIGGWARPVRPVGGGYNGRRPRMWRNW